MDCAGHVRERPSVGASVAILEMTDSAFHGTDLAAVIPAAAEQVVYTELCALRFLGRQEEMPAFVADYVKPWVSDGELRARIAVVLERTDLELDECFVDDG